MCENWRLGEQGIEDNTKLEKLEIINVESEIEHSLWPAMLWQNYSWRSVCCGSRKVKGISIFTLPTLLLQEECKHLSVHSVTAL
jgi:hypothetical protein